MKRNFSRKLKKKEEAAKKKEAGGDEKHMFFFTWPYPGILHFKFPL